MNEHYTPSEFLEASDKAKQYEKGREQAKFYRLFLDNFRSAVVSQLLRKDLNGKLGVVDMNTTDLPLKKFEFCDIEDIREYMKNALNEANETAGTSENLTGANPTQIADMTPIEFYRYIDDLKATLIKK